VAEATQERVTELTAQLDGLGKAAEAIRITRKTSLSLRRPSFASGLTSDPAGARPCACAFRG
jgi:hypothetical protein